MMDAAERAAGRALMPMYLGVVLIGLSIGTALAIAAVVGFERWKRRND
ncbi:putative membrane protein [Synechococcus sp. Minos11]|nr:putative membrane protein [Synechococcus sp. Minos11]